MLHGLFENIDDFEFTFLPVWMNQEKRGHLFTSSPLNFILTQNKQSLDEGKEPLDVESTIALIVDRMNAYLRDIKEDDFNHITHKISHFTQLYGIIYLFFSDQSIIDTLQESFTVLDRKFYGIRQYE